MSVGDAVVTQWQEKAILHLHICPPLVLHMPLVFKTGSGSQPCFFLAEIKSWEKAESNQNSYCTCPQSILPQKPKCIYMQVSLIDCLGMHVLM